MKQKMVTFKDVLKYFAKLVDNSILSTRMIVNISRHPYYISDFILRISVNTSDLSIPKNNAYFDTTELSMYPENIINVSKEFYDNILTNFRLDSLYECQCPTTGIEIYFIEDKNVPDPEYSVYIKWIKDGKEIISKYKITDKVPALGICINKLFNRTIEKWNDMLYDPYYAELIENYNNERCSSGSLEYK